jgi:hypothetical protein
LKEGKEGKIRIRVHKNLSIILFCSSFSPFLFFLFFHFFLMDIGGDRKSKRRSTLFLRANKSEHFPLELPQSSSEERGKFTGEIIVQLPNGSEKEFNFPKKSIVIGDIVTQIINYYKPISNTQENNARWESDYGLFLPYRSDFQKYRGLLMEKTRTIASYRLPGKVRIGTKFEESFTSC